MHLRVGMVLDGQLVEERVFARGPVTFGQSLRCALSVPLEGVPREHVLFTHDGGRWRVHATPAMNVVEHGQRGKVAIGGAVLLFQEVPAPVAVPPLQLPASIRGTLADRIDRRLALIIGASLAVHIAIAVLAWARDIEERPLGMPSVATYREEIIDVTLPDLTAPATTTHEPGALAPVPVAPRQTPRSIVQRPLPMPSGADAQRLATLLTGDEASETGRGDMSPRQPGADLNKQIDEARTRVVTIGDSTHTSRIDDHARVDDRHASHFEAPQRVERQTRDDEKKPTRIRIDTVKPETQTTLTPAVVLEWINTRYMAGLQHCYRLGLNKEGTLAGRVAISFTVDERGRLIDADAKGVSNGVDSCIAKQMEIWRFPIPKDKDGDATDASFSVSLALQPS